MTYAIKINDRYFKDYVYAADLKTSGRHAGNTKLGSLISPDDIVDIITTEKPERTETRRSIGSTIACILDIEKYKKSNIVIEYIE